MCKMIWTNSHGDAQLVLATETLSQLLEQVNDTWVILNIGNSLKTGGIFLAVQYL